MEAKEKEKAIELVERFLPLVRNSDLYDNYYNKAKQCAIIAVDEVIENNRILLDGIKYHEELNYWQEVKSELLNLK